jgi:hypothetical protein
MIEKIIWRISSEGCRLESALQMYYAEETFARDVLSWWLVWGKIFPSWTWRDTKIVIQHRFVLHCQAKRCQLLVAPKSLATKPVDSF